MKNRNPLGSNNTKDNSMSEQKNLAIQLLPTLWSHKHVSSLQSRKVENATWKLVVKQLPVEVLASTIQCFELLFRWRWQWLSAFFSSLLSDFVSYDAIQIRSHAKEKIKRWDLLHYYLKMVIDPI